MLRPDYSFGTVQTTTKQITFYIENHDAKEQQVEQKSMITQCMDTSNPRLVLEPGSEIITHYSVKINRNGEIVLQETGSLNETHSYPIAMASWGPTVSIVGKFEQMYKLQECGVLNFGLRLSEALNLMYHAIGYLPSHGNKHVVERSFPETIEECKVLAGVIQEMQWEKENIFPSRSSFSGIEGNVFTTTAACLSNTIDDRELLVQRLELIGSSIIINVHPNDIVNESVIEHSFVYVNLKAKKRLLDMYDCIHNKAKHEIDFQMRMTHLPFNQYNKIKLWDKSYQNLQSSVFSGLDMDDFWDMFCEVEEATTLRLNQLNLLRRNY